MLRKTLIALTTIAILGLGSTVMAKPKHSGGHRGGVYSGGAYYSGGGYGGGGYGGGGYIGGGPDGM
jgi:uncharacterized membrane protein